MPDSQQIIPVPIDQEIQDSYMTYAMSVIVSRALPDVRDGLKPVHRRILFAQNEINNTPNNSYKKCAEVVGEVMGKYHPHGDMAIYNTLVRMAQTFSMRYLLTDGQGNFGSIDGYPAAAMRYTECKMTHMAVDMCRDLDKNTVDFAPNYNDSRKEPIVLPAAVPNLLINGSSGIAVGMSTSMPPHNIREVVDGIIAYIDNQEIDLDGLMQHIKGPDFPTGGIIRGKSGIKEAYRTGRGKVKLEAKMEFETSKKGNKDLLVIYEIPYMVSKSALLQKIAGLVSDKKIEGISFLRDESDRSGMRIVIEIKKGSDPRVVQNQLLKHTQLRSSISIINLALINNRPQVFSLKGLIEAYITHRLEIIVRRTQYDLDKAKKRLHILEGLLIAQDNIDEVIALIRASENRDAAKTSLMQRFALSDEQATEILKMTLGQLTKLDRDKLQQEYDEIKELIQQLEEILADEAKRYGIIKEELLAAKEKFGDDRRTQIEGEADEIEAEDLISEEEAIITVSMNGYIKRLPITTYKKQRRGGKGVTGGGTKNDDVIRNIISASTHDHLLFFSNKGRCFFTKIYEIPEASRTARGKSMKLILSLEDGEDICAFLNARELSEGINVMIATRNGVVKKTPLSLFASARARGIKAINLDEGDEIVTVLLTEGNDEVMFLSKFGNALRIHEKQVRTMGRTARGVRGMRLKDGDTLLQMVKVDDTHLLLPITSKGYGKTVEFSQFKAHGRGTGGQIYIKTTHKTGTVVGALVVEEECEVVAITQHGMVIRMGVSEISTYGRTAAGLRLVKVKNDDQVVDIARLFTNGEEQE